MRASEQRRWLKDHGFEFVRNGSRHQIWQHRSGYKFAVPYGSKSTEPRAWRNALAHMRRAGVI